MVVVLIVGILAVAALPQYNRAIWRAKYSELQTLVRTFAESASHYYLANGVPPDYWRDMDIGVPIGYSALDTVAEGPMFCHNNRVYCDLRVGSTLNIICFLKEGPDSFPIAYVQYFSPVNQTRECWAALGNTQANAFCSGLGGMASGQTDHAACISAGGYALPASVRRRFVQRVLARPFAWRKNSYMAAPFSS